MKKPNIQTIIMAILILVILLLVYDKWGAGIVSGIKYKLADEGTKDQLQIGNSDAKIKIVEYYSYTCEYCRDFENTTKPRIMNDYVSSGAVKYVFRPIDPEFGDAALCANEQGKFLEYHDSLFRNATSIQQAEDLKVLASNVGMDVEKFWECYSSGKYQQLVEGWYNDLMSDFTKYRISSEEQGTPFFLVGSTPIAGAQSYSVFSEAIDKELK